MARHRRVCLAVPTTNVRLADAAIAQALKTTKMKCYVQVVVDDKRAGGCNTANRVLVAAYRKHTPYICYMNDDVQIRQEGWLERLVEVMDKNPRCGIAAPGCDCGTRPQKQGRSGLPRGTKRVQRLSFVTAIFRRELFDSIGFLDDGYYHWGCDTDLCERARRAGWDLLYVQDVFVIHKRTPLWKRPKYIQDWKGLDLARWKARKK